MGAFLTGAAVTSGPWLLTTAVLVLMRLSAIQAGVADVAAAQAIITVVFAGVVVLSAPIDIVLSRYAADRVYEKRRDQIVAPLRIVVAVGMAIFAAFGAATMVLLEQPLGLAIPGAMLAAIVGAQWLLLSAAGGLSSPGIILRAFAIGAPVSVVCSIGLPHVVALGAAGYLYGFGAGQLVTLGLLLWGTLRALPAEEDEDARFLPALRDYWLLAAAAFAFHAGIWIDKLVVLVLSGSHIASVYAATAAVAWLSVVPGCAYLFVTVETAFERRFRAFYSALHTGASLPELEHLARDLRLEVFATLRGTAAVQSGVTLVCLLAAPAVADRLMLNAAGTATLSWLLLGAALQMLALAATLLLYYFDFRAEAFSTAVMQLLSNGLLTLLVAGRSNLLGAGYAGASVVASVVAILLLRKRMTALLERTFQSQPYSSEPS